MGLLPGFLPASLVGNVYPLYCNFGILTSKATVDVRVFNVANMTILNETHTFILPVLPGHKSAIFPINISCLISGYEKILRTLILPLLLLFSSGFAQLEPYKDIAVLLQNRGINLMSIDTVIWSHAHFDHVICPLSPPKGDMSTFPNSTKLIIGPDTDLTTFPESPTVSFQESVFTGHNINRVNFANTTLTFSGLKAIDSFGDRSFYLVDTPGDLPGHLTALVHVTPTSFIVLGGDTFHHARQACPQPQFQKNFSCPTHLLKDSKSAISTDFFWSLGSHIGAFNLPSLSQLSREVLHFPNLLLLAK
ncbi:hypothetical protein B0H14DRAFT_2609847 [Mycena olivaceomarginata]|nr:hypothetical protein B0H14DRAFT_2609847 [Mycena olivaceomarginata]